jgi:hypothetical protein
MEALDLEGAGSPQLAPTAGPWCQWAGWRAVGRAAPPVLPAPPLLRRGMTTRATDGMAGLREAPGRSTGPASMASHGNRHGSVVASDLRWERVCAVDDGIDGAGV